MGLRFRKRIKLAPGIHVNLSRNGISTSIGPRGLTTNIKPGRKSTTTIGIPGSGLSYTTSGSSAAPTVSLRRIILLALALTAVIGAALLLTACYGTRFNWDDARRIQPGMTEQQVVAIMGDPLSVAVTPNGNAWVWTYADGFGHARTLSVLFKDGKVATAPAVPTALR